MKKSQQHTEKKKTPMFTENDYLKPKKSEKEVKSSRIKQIENSYKQTLY